MELLKVLFRYMQLIPYQKKIDAAKAMFPTLVAHNSLHVYIIRVKG